MRDFILLMHDDALEPARADDEDAWGKYLEELRQSGRFVGGSALGGGQCYALSGTRKDVSSHLTGYLLVQAADMDEARKFLTGNPVYEANGTVEIRELPRS